MARRHHAAARGRRCARRGALAHRRLRADLAAAGLLIATPAPTPTRSGLPAPIVGHVGDGNFHMAFMIDPGDQAELERARQLDELIVSDALARGGTCSGEHGIGLGSASTSRASIPTSSRSTAA